VGRRCRQATIKDVAKELALDWHAVKALEKQYMEAQLARAGTPGPQVIGIDEIAIPKGHSYRIVVSDLIRERPSRRATWTAVQVEPPRAVGMPRCKISTVYVDWDMGDGESVEASAGQGERSSSREPRRPRFSRKST
jgi:hypothetical protein